MKFYTTIQEVNLDTTIVEKARKFAEDVIPTINYSDSNQTVIKKIQFDHFVSKLGEEAAVIVLSQYAVMQGPDYNIYSAAQKSWREDLLVNNTGVAVKTQTRSAASRYGLSWTFQCGSKRHDPILNTPEAWVVFVECNDFADYHCRVYPPFQIRELVFKDPTLPHLKGLKKVVYANTLIL